MCISHDAGQRLFADDTCGCGEIHRRETKTMPLDGRCHIDIFVMGSMKKNSGCIVPSIAATTLGHQVGVELINVLTLQSGSSPVLHGDRRKFRFDRDSVAIGCFEHDVGLHLRHEGNAVVHPPIENSATGYFPAQGDEMDPIESEKSGFEEAP